jgi:hypothetical protein
MRTPTMEFGLFDNNQGACHDPAVLIRTAQQAELAGLEPAWAVDLGRLESASLRHVVW